MAGKTSPQITAAAPAPTEAPSVPAPVVATGNNDTPSSPPPAPVVKAAPKAKAAPSKGMAIAPTSAPDTTAQTNADFEASVREIEDQLNGEVQESKAEKTGKEKAPPLKGAEKDSATEKDENQDELDAAAAAAGIKKAEVADDSKKVEAEKEEDGPEPDEKTEPDKFDAWIAKRDPQAAERLTRLRNQMYRERAERIILQPTAEAPLSHINNLEQLEAETSYWKDIRAKTKSGDVVEIRGTDGKKLTLDPDIEDDAKTIARYAEWAETAIEQAPDAKERINGRLSSKPWEHAEKLVPGMISDKESFANKTALGILGTKWGSELMRNDPNYEVTVAEIVHTRQMKEDQKPTEAYPKGKAKWVRLPLDKEGNVISPKKAVASTKDAGKKPPTAIDSKPVVTARVSNANADSLYSKFETSHDEADLRRALAEELR